VLTDVIQKDSDAAVFSEIAVELENLTQWDRHDGGAILFDPSEESPRQ
jgi:hypothetical protein